MNTQTKEDLTLQLIINPNLLINDVKGIKFQKAQIFGAFKVKINLTRKRLSKFLKDKNEKRSEFAKEINILNIDLNNFINGKPVNEKSAKILTNLITTLPLDKVSLKRKKSLTNSLENDFNNQDGDGKKYVRGLFYKHLTNSKKSGKFFVLPSADCRFEIGLNEKIKNTFHYIGVEVKKSVFETMKKTSIENNLDMSHLWGYSDEFTSVAKPNTYTHAFNDYCGNFPTFESEIRTMLQNNVIKMGGLLGLTFSLREATNTNQGSLEYLNIIINNLNLPNEVKKNLEVTVKQGIKLKILSMLGNTYQLIEFVQYNDKSKMIFALIKRIS